MSGTSKLFMDYIRHKFGNSYRESTTRPWLIRKIIQDNLFDDVCEFALKSDGYSEKTVDSLVHLIKHVQHKISDGKNFYCMLPGYVKPGSNVPAVMFKTIPALLHYKEDRLFTIREYLHLMGMPSDYELPGDINSNYAKIGQNVPARTAQWIVSEAVRIVENWDSVDRNNEDILFIDNTRQKVV